MAKYVLTKPMFTEDCRYLEAGTEYETDNPPSLGMEGADEEGIAKCKERDEKRKQSQTEAVASGRMSKVTAENLGPKPEKPPDNGDGDEPSEEHHRGRRPRR